MNEVRKMEIGYDFLRSFANENKIAVYEANVGNKIRFIAPYKDIFYIIFWLQVLKDGSIYCGIRNPKATKYKTGTAIPGEKGLAISYDDGQPMNEITRYDKMRMSFHGSGEIHTIEYGKITMRTPLINLTTQEELFLALFQEPSKFEPITSLRKKDILILSEILPDHPLFLQAYISSAKETQIVNINEGKCQFTAVLEYHNIDNIGDMNIQLCFNFASEGKYPPYSYLLWPSTGVKDITPPTEKS